MNSCPPLSTPLRRAVSLLVIALFALVGNPRARAAEAGPLHSSAVSPVPSYALLDMHRQKSPQPAPRLRLNSPDTPPWMSQPRNDFSSPRFRDDAFLSGKGLISTELKWATHLSPAIFHLLFGASKAQVARSLHAERIRKEQVRNVHETIDMIAWTDPQRAKTYRNLMYDAMVRAK